MFRGVLAELMERVSEVPGDLRGETNFGMEVELGAGQTRRLKPTNSTLSQVRRFKVILEKFET